MAWDEARDCVVYLEVIVCKQEKVEDKRSSGLLQQVTILASRIFEGHYGLFYSIAKKFER